MTLLITNANLLTPFEEIENAAIRINTEGSIEAITPMSDVQTDGCELLDAKGKYAIPGLIDLHVHGGNGISFGLGDLAAELDAYARWIASFGETGFLLSVTGPNALSIEQTVQTYAELLAHQSAGAQVLGLHLEGPFLNPEKHGAFNLDWIHAPNLAEIQRYLKAGQGWVRQVSLAPELPQSDVVAQFLASQGVIAALGHSNTDYATAAAALKGPFSHVTHTFNAQSAFNHREPGVIGAVLASERVTAELIADGLHVHPAAMKVLLLCLGLERVALITDAMPGAGLPDGEYDLVGQKISVVNGKAALPDGTLGGSTVTINACVRNLHQMCAVPLLDAVRMASYNPAAILGLQDQIGSLEIGKLANLAIVDKNMNVFNTFVKGRQVYASA